MNVRWEFPDLTGLRFADVAQVRVIYGDTDRMGVVYHGTYARYLEHGRVELMRGFGVPYVDVERQGLGLPVTDLRLRYLGPARYDDLVTISVALCELGFARVGFAYRLWVQPGDRAELDAPLEVLQGLTRHGCVELAGPRATRLPGWVHEALGRALAHARGPGTPT